MSLFPHLHTTPLPVPNKLLVSADVKHHVYFAIGEWTREMAIVTRLKERKKERKKESQRSDRPKTHAIPLPGDANFERNQSGGVIG